MRFLKFSCLFTFYILIINTAYCSNRDLNESIALSEKLNELEMYDLSLYLLEKTVKKYPQDRDMVMVQKAQTLFSMRKPEEGTSIINTIGSGSPAYAFSRYVLGTSAIGRGDNATGTKALEEYCAYMKNNMPERGSVLDKQFERGVSYLIFAYKKDGKLKDLERVRKFLEWPRAGEDGAEKAPDNPYEETVINAQMKLDAAEIMKSENKPDWKKTVEELIPKLKEVYWSGRSPYSAMASIEIAKANCMLEKYKEALAELDKYWDLIKAMDEGYRSEGLVPPSAKAYLWKGNAYLGLGEKATEDEEKKKNLFKAAQNFLVVIAKYDQKKCRQTGKAVAGFNKAKALLAEIGIKLNPPSNVKMPSGFDRKRADDMFNKEKYAEAVPLYMEILQSPGGRTSSDAPDILNRTAFSYLKTGKILESLALATYLGEYFPENEETPVALLRVGETLWKEYKKSPNTPKGKAAQDEALMLYKTFLENCPTHEFADEISARSAKVYFDRANELAIEANKMPNGPEKVKKNEEAREAFKEAIPIYQHILDNYLHTDLGKSSALLLAWCYTNSRQYVKGAEVFAKFADAEYNREKKEKRNFGNIAEAKFRVAENYSRAAGDLEKEAKKLKKEAEVAPTEDALKSYKPEKGKPLPMSEQALLKKSEETKNKAIEYFKVSVVNLNELLDKWMKPGGRLSEAKSAADQKKIKEIEEKATSLLAWSYDGSRDDENAIKAFKNFIKKYPKNKDIPKSMLRLGMLYITIDKPNEAAAVLNELSDKYPEEGKKALPKLARTMYEIGNYEKSIDAAAKIFEGNPNEIPVPEIKWIARHLYDCEGRYPEKGAQVALKACDILKEKIKKPVMADWIGKDKAKALENNPEELTKMVNILKDQLLFITANAAYHSKQYSRAIAALDELLANKESPYFVKGHFLRADAYMGNNQPEKALKNDFNAISLYLFGAKDVPESVRFENQCKIGDAFVMLKDYGKALGAYSFVTMTLISSTDKDLAVAQKEVSPAEKKKQRKLIEYAVFMSACCEKKLGNNDKAESMADLYKKHFNNGKYRSKIDALPTPEEAMKLK